MDAALPIEPWCISEKELDLEALGQTESLFALANGHLGLRGNLDEGEPFNRPGTYLNSFYESRPLPHAEPAYGNPESGQTIINVTNGKLIRLLVDDEPFDIRYGRLNKHERHLDLRSGTLSREVDWTSPAGQSAIVRSTRMVSFTQRAVAAICYEVEAVEKATRVVIQSELVANEPMPPFRKDPRVSAALESPLVAEYQSEWETGAALVHMTKASKLRLAAAMDHLVEGPESVAVEMSAQQDIARTTFTCQLGPGEKLRITKYLAYGWSGHRSRAALFDQVIAALNAARYTGWDELVAEQGLYLDRFWAGADIEIDGDVELQQAVRFGLFHVLQAGARAEERPIAAKGLTGTGYEGHAFWDTEIFVLPVFNHTLPKAAADVLRWRHSTLDAARDRAKALGLKGASFPWRTIGGQECSGYWPAGTAAFHINADIAYAVTEYIHCTGDEQFDRDVGVELLVETARLWYSLGHFDREGKFRIDGVTGPDEYDALSDNNVYTNLMARHNLRAAAEAVERHPDIAGHLNVHEHELASWSSAAASVYIPFDDRLRVHPQCEGYTLRQSWDFAHTDPESYPLLLNYPYFDLYRKQVIKQADLVLAMHLQSRAFSEEQKARNFIYYERITVRDSSLSAATQAVVAAELGHLDLAYDYLGETALVDLKDVHRNAKDGVHIASMAGAWSALVSGFGGMRTHGPDLYFSPRLPAFLNRISFNLRHHDRRLSVVILPNYATYKLQSGEPLTLRHHGETFELTTDKAITYDIPQTKARTYPVQPVGREPRRRHTTLNRS
ncbi:MAG: glycosyl hydrolase family 65 protein [Actinomycetota bacterium]